MSSHTFPCIKVNLLCTSHVIWSVDNGVLVPSSVITKLIRWFDNLCLTCI